MAKIKTLDVLGITQFAPMNADCYVNTISEHLKTSHSHVNKPHKHDFFATFLFTKGSGSHEIDFSVYEVKPNAIFLLSPGQTHNWQLSPDVEGIVFFHSQEFYEAQYLHDFLSDYPFFSNVQNQAAIYLDVKMAAEMALLFEKLLFVNSRKYVKKKQLLLGLITQIYVELENTLGTNASGEANRHGNYYLSFLKFQRLVEQNFMTEKAVQNYADLMNMTAKHLNRINREVLNKTTLEIITDRVMLEAKRILIFGRKNVSEVAEELGYADYSHFSKIFRNKTGQTPTDFLKSYE